MASDMTFIISKKSNPYGIINRNILHNKNLSWKAKSVLLYLLDKPEGTELSFNDLLGASTDGRDATRSGVNELIKYGYITKNCLRSDDGKFLKWTYICREEPLEPFTGNPYTGKVEPETENPEMDPQTENPELDETRQNQPLAENPELANVVVVVNNNIYNKTNKTTTTYTGEESKVKELLSLFKEKSNGFEFNRDNLISLLRNPKIGYQTVKTYFLNMHKFKFDDAPAFMYKAILKKYTIKPDKAPESFPQSGKTDTDDGYYIKGNADARTIEMYRTGRTIF